MMKVKTNAKEDHLILPRKEPLQEANASIQILTILSDRATIHLAVRHIGELIAISSTADISVITNLSNNIE